MSTLKTVSTMKTTKKPFKSIPALLVVVVLFLSAAFISCSDENETTDNMTFKQRVHVHHDHSQYFPDAVTDAQDLTKRCLECHEDAASQIMQTSHWKWVGDAVKVPGHEKPMKIGKKNLINNFCIGIQGNWPSCTKCHAGYGWSDETFDFENKLNVDCLVCHDQSGNYKKTSSGWPDESVDLQAVAKSVGFPKRENCGYCHVYGGGGMGVKHGDLDNSLNNPSERIDVHMGGHNMLCIDCHGGDTNNPHNIKGKSISVSVDDQNGINCTDCHSETPHTDGRLNSHTSAVACETCHIPMYAYKAPTKMHWDWSKAGDDTRPDNPHEYLKIKGEFIYKEQVIPEYYWFNKKAERYILGDKINPDDVTPINKPMGDINDPTAKIWPFKVHRGNQIYDKVNKYFIPPVTSGEGGYWHDFDWEKAMQLGSKVTGMKYSGEYGFANTEMFWPLSHMVVSGKHALKCADCHDGGERMNWKALGYQSDPMLTGGRK